MYHTQERYTLCIWIISIVVTYFKGSVHGLSMTKLDTELKSCIDSLSSDEMLSARQFHKHYLGPVYQMINST